MGFQILGFVFCWKSNRKKIEPAVNFLKKKRRIAAVCLVENEIGAPTQARAQSNDRKGRMALFFYSYRKTFDFYF